MCDTTCRSHSGTYIAIDTLVLQGEDTKADLSITETVASMRRARNFMVQTLVSVMLRTTCLTFKQACPLTCVLACLQVQYGFVYLSVLDAIDRGLGRAKQVRAPSACAFLACPCSASRPPYILDISACLLAPLL